MEQIIKNYLTQLKSKQLAEYTISELYDKTLDLTVLYTYSNDKESLNALRPIFVKMTEWINDKKRGYVINPGALDNIDKHRH